MHFLCACVSAFLLTWSSLGPPPSSSTAGRAALSSTVNNTACLFHSQTSRYPKDWICSTFLESSNLLQCFCQKCSCSTGNLSFSWEKKMLTPYLGRVLYTNDAKLPRSCFTIHKHLSSLVLSTTSLKLLTCPPLSSALQVVYQ